MKDKEDEIRLWKGDCLVEMNKIKDNSVDMILADLPYGSVINSNWDKIIDIDKMWIHYNRIITDNGCIALFATNPFASKLISSNYKMYRYEWVWDKHIARGAFLAKHRPMTRHEHVLIFGKNKVVYFPIMTKREKTIKIRDYTKNGNAYNPKYTPSEKVFNYEYKNPETIIQGMWMANKGKLHPTQKPVSLLEYLILTYTLPNQTILDNTMGVGSTGVAAKQLNRKFIGIEKEQKYYDLAVNRIMNETVWGSSL